MRTKTLVILFIILGVLVGTGTLIFRLKAPERSHGRLGTQLLEQLPVNKIISITIEDPENTVFLVKNQEGWVVKNRFNYPADFSKITDLVRNLKEMKVGRQFESSEDTLKRLSLKEPTDHDASPDEKGVRIQLRGEGETSLAGILLGKTRMVGDERSFPDGQYLKMNKEPNIFLVNKHFSYLERKPFAWLEKSLVEVESSEVKKISCKSPDGKKVHYTFERSEKGKDLEPVNLSIDGKIDRSAVNRLAKSISSLGMEDIMNPSATAGSDNRNTYTLFEYHLFNGIVYRVYTSNRCSEDEGCYLKIEVNYQKPVGVKDEKAKDDKSMGQEDSPEKTPQEYAFEAKSLHARLSPWVYKIPQWQHTAFITDLDQLLEKPKEKQKEKG